MTVNTLAIMPVMDTSLSVERYNHVVEFVRKIMKDGVDFGVVPGTDKPTLLKPGAEKLTTFFGLTKKFQVIEKTEDWTGRDHNNEPFFYYLYRCQLWQGDLLAAEADGSCNSYESKYRWRWVDEFDVPLHLDKDLLKRRVGRLSEFEFAIQKAETTGKYGKPAEYWQRFRDAIEEETAYQVTKQTSRGQSYSAYEIETVSYRVPNEDIASQVNTIQKMAQKRALIAATLLAVNASEFFTQDLEDIIDADFVEAQPEVKAPEVKPAPPDKGMPTFDTMDDFLFQLNQDFGLSEDEAKAILKSLGYTGFPANGDKRRKSAEMYKAVKRHTEKKLEQPALMDASASQDGAYGEDS